MIQHACILKYGFTELVLIHLSEKNHPVLQWEKPYMLSMVSGFQALKKNGLKS